MRNSPDFSWEYSDLNNKPTLGSASVLNVAEEGNASDTEVVKGDDSRLTNASPIQRIRVQTDTSGEYNWTFPIAYGASVVPVIGLTVEDSSTDAWHSQVTALDNASTTIKLTRFGIVSVLGVDVLSPSGSSPQAYVHLIAVAP